MRLREALCEDRAFEGDDRGAGVERSANVRQNAEEGRLCRGHAPYYVLSAFFASEQLRNILTEELKRC
jgi:hypothetical protein